MLSYNPSANIKTIEKVKMSTKIYILDCPKISNLMLWKDLNSTEIIQNFQFMNKINTEVMNTKITFVTATTIGNPILSRITLSAS